MSTKIVEKFNSIAEFLSAIEKRPGRGIYSDETACESLSTNRRFVKFSGSHSMDEAKQLIRKGWKEALPNFQKVKDSRPAQAPRRKVVTGVAGFVPHVPNAILGLPNSMIYSKRVMAKAKTLEIVYNASVLGDVTTKQMTAAGVAMLSAVKEIEAAGTRVKLTGCFKGSKLEDEYHIVSVKLKDYGQPLDLQKLCFPLAHPSAMRRLGFRWFETNPLLQEEWGYGSSISEVDTFRDVYGCGKDCKVILAMQLVGRSPEGMRDYIFEQIKKQ